jgi:site-specific DNA-methyltransferase (cytosine-N4-specific)
MHLPKSWPTVQPSLWSDELATIAKQSHPQSAKPQGKVLEGDAFDLIKTIPARSVDLIITSPPYWGLRTYDAHHNWDILEEWKKQSDDPDAIPSYSWYSANGGVLGLEPTPDWYVHFLTDLFDLARPALKTHGSVWVNIGDTYFARWASIRDKGRQGLGGHPRERRRVPMGSYRQEKQLLLIPSRFAIEMQRRRWILRNDLIWHKPNVPPRPERDRLRLSHEHFFHFVLKPKEGRAKYYYDLAATEPASNDVVIVNSQSGGEHSATFPEALITPRVLSSSMRGGTVLDPFAGTGKALAVAMKNGRKAIGFERSPKFVQLARRLLLEVHE